MTIRLLIADDHRIMREGLVRLFEEQPDLEVVGEAGDGDAAVRLVRELDPDVVVMDVGMPRLNGIDATRRILEQEPRVKVIALSCYTDRNYVLAMLDSGARGYLLKTSASEELTRAIRAVVQGQHYLCPAVAGAVVSSHLAQQPLTAGSAFQALGPREREVTQLLAEGLTSREIAARMFISTKTVETHRRNIMRKLDLHSVADLTKYAIRQGLTSLEE